MITEESVGGLSPSESEVIKKLRYDKQRDIVVVDASVQSKPSTFLLGPQFSMSNAVQAVGFRLADGTDALCMVNRFDQDGGSYSNPKFFALGESRILNVNLDSSVVMQSPIPVGYTTAADNLTYSFEVMPATSGRMICEYWLGGDDSGAPIVDFHRDITQEEVDSNQPILVEPNFYLLAGGSQLFVRFTGVSLKGDGVRPWFRSKVLPYKEITLNTHTEVVNTGQTLYVGCDYIWYGEWSSPTPPRFIVPDTFKDPFTFTDGSELGLTDRVAIDFTAYNQGVFHLRQARDSFAFFYKESNDGQGSGWYWLCLNTKACRRVNGDYANVDKNCVALAIGDTKFSYQSADHDGWYRLNGRAISTLPTFARSAATWLGLSGNLPNTQGRYARAAGGSLLGSGSNLGLGGDFKLPRSALPNVTLSYSGTTSSNGTNSSNTQTRFSNGNIPQFEDPDLNWGIYQCYVNFQVPPGGDARIRWLLGRVNEATVKSVNLNHSHFQDIPNHNHTYSGNTASINGGVSQTDNEPAYAGKYEFIYLGL
ncbi:hypothetical protein [Vibrio cholerae]|uniref:hypothetical protein n=1 Tax=Vibrio cholerae TaxID=666 RepID=UPI0004E2E760|nr:hypothetical protein [Vibrio cholerae]EGR1087874.1 hypothetical protein [Vibrio cholerae]KFE25004.1 hypothetical protein DA89_242 [Vibrio cholerae]TXZ35058.1 hypothetical protein FXE66_05730 [Vibrio cholerae]BCK29977.1 hypothetical protein VCSRO77_3396 [Vibrio cholerae]